MCAYMEEREYELATPILELFENCVLLYVKVVSPVLSVSSVALVADGGKLLVVIVGTISSNERCGFKAPAPNCVYTVVTPSSVPVVVVVPRNWIKGSTNDPVDCVVACCVIDCCGTAVVCKYAGMWSVVIE